MKEKRVKQNYFGKKVCVIGMGYVGLPTASILATKGYNVLGVDVNEKIVKNINAGLVHIVEPDLDVLVKSAVNSKRLRASLKPQNADIFIIAVPTPFKENYSPDLTYVEEAVKSILPHLKPGNIVILESTSPVGTTENIIAKLIKKRGLRIGKDIFIAYCPERVLPGKILQELIYNDRIVGGIDKASSDAVVDFYRSFVSGEIFITNAATSEMAKLTENAFRDVNIAFANELSIICEDANIDVWELIRLANKHPRVNILQPGPGVGGHCIAVDPWFIISRFPGKSKLMEKAREINDYKIEWIVDKVLKHAQKLTSPVIGCLGITYKPDIDDLRESPALKIALNFKEKGLKVICSEPNINKKEVKGLTIKNTCDVIKESNILVLLVAHKEFKTIDYKNLKNKIIIEAVKI